ncbi:hypothetical protein MLD38_023729 [Melastoma candidum]|uniref:Uncharacterized protein n=1 Tax=Melastoma candidum TaxID=119954 RepID=A0ACB9NT01_9MYRT|nr:hypothetical protein MLD38_023729 [Melastoma candidum]
MNASHSWRKASSFLRGHAKHLALFTLSGGSLVAYADSRSEGGASSADLVQKENGKKRVSRLFRPGIISRSPPCCLVSTCGTVEARSIVEPVRNIIKKSKGEIDFYEADCLKIDAANNKVFCRSNLEENLAGDPEFSLEYDYLVVAVGAQVNTFNTPGVLENCHFLKEVEDAQKIRRSVIDRFEKSVLPGLTEEERKKNLHFVIVGGGPTGVEFAAELHDFIQEDIVRIYPMLKEFIRISLVNQEITF